MVYTTAVTGRYDMAFLHLCGMDSYCPGVLPYVLPVYYTCIYCVVSRATAVAHVLSVSWRC